MLHQPSIIIVSYPAAGENRVDTAIGVAPTPVILSSVLALELLACVDPADVAD